MRSRCLMCAHALAAFAREQPRRARAAGLEVITRRSRPALPAYCTRRRAGSGARSVYADQRRFLLSRVVRKRLRAARGQGQGPVGRRRRRPRSAAQRRALGATGPGLARGRAPGGGPPGRQGPHSRFSGPLALASPPPRPADPAARPRVERRPRGRGPGPGPSSQAESGPGWGAGSALPGLTPLPPAPPAPERAVWGSREQLGPRVPPGGHPASPQGRSRASLANPAPRAAGEAGTGPAQAPRGQLAPRSGRGPTRPQRGQCGDSVAGPAPGDRGARLPAAPPHRAVHPAPRRRRRIGAPARCTEPR